MKLLTKDNRESLPELYAQDGKGDDAVVQVKFFHTGYDWRWYATEATAYVDVGEDDYLELPLSDIEESGNNRFVYLHNDKWYPVEEIRFFGLVNGFAMELGTFSFNELLSFGWMLERDRHFDPITLRQVRELIKERGWA